MSDDPIAQLEIERNAEKLAAKAADLKQNVDVLTEEINKYELKIDALSEQAETKRRTMQQAFCSKHEKRYADIDKKKAFIYGDARHTVTIAKFAQFVLSVPVGNMIHAVEDFIRKPKPFKDPTTGKDADMGEVNHFERTLLVYLNSCVLLDNTGAPGPEQNLAAMPLVGKLQAIRSLPAATSSMLADEAMTMQTYLNAYLELEMGN